MKNILTALGLLLGYLDVGSVRAGDRYSGEPWVSRSEVIAQHGMAATSQPLATQVAIDILRQGGNAIDAAIAANAVLGLMEPTSCGIGGDIFVLVWDSGSQKLYGLNGSGRSPKSLTRAYFDEQKITQMPNFGPIPVTVPGCVDGWFMLHERFGKLPMKDVLAPAIRYAKEGFPVSELIAHYWRIGGERLKAYPNFATTYLPEGRAPAKGEIFRNPLLARTYEILADKGRDAFYEGELADVLDSFSQRVGCFLRKEDLVAHHSEWVEPISTNYRGYEVWQLPPNTQGAAVLQMLNLLETFNLQAMGFNSADYLHTMIEVKKIVYEDRAKYYADPQFAKLPLQDLLSKEYAQQRRTLLNPQRAAAQYDAGDPALITSDTIYLTVADRDHNMVSLIQSNYRGFGSGLVPDGLGFCLQDRGALFSLQAGHANEYAPNKRPFHTIIPGFVTRDGQPLMSFGVMGGDMQPQGQVQILCNIIDFGMNLQQAGDAPRWYHGGSSEPTGETISNGGFISLESAIPEAVVKELLQRGHRLNPQPGIYGGYQAIWYDAKQNIYYGASESRKDGCALGY
ncbi:MAG: Glutathione hydrolase-like YwrD proenzyme [Phycisphaerae bacterium]|nr:Glutathione hydrolase-like YwrD proenzyme [Phycisphaerae bacterium]